MNSGFLGIDTSNYTTSTAVVSQEKLYMQRKLLSVAKGQLGLRQSDAVFAHVKSLGQLMQLLFEQYTGEIRAIGVSKYPRDEEGSYMPCFLAGVMAAQATAAAMRLPLFSFSHQSGHLSAAICSAARQDLMEKPFIAFHLSGGTTECIWVRNLALADFTVLSETNDLNAGQAVDRVGMLLGLEFPAGKALDALANDSVKTFHIKPTVRNNNPCLSGIENQCKAMLEKGEARCDIARFCLLSIAEALVYMAQTAVAQTGITELVFAGGVMSNSIIRPLVLERVGGTLASAELSTDNAAGIAYLTQYCYETGRRPNGFDLD